MQEYINKLEQVQQTAIKMFPGMHHMPHEERMKDKGLASLEKKCWVKSLKEQIQTGRQTTVVYDVGHYGHNLKKKR